MCKKMSCRFYIHTHQHVTAQYRSVIYPEMRTPHYHAFSTPLTISSFGMILSWVHFIIEDPGARIGCMCMCEAVVHMTVTMAVYIGSLESTHWQQCWMLASVSSCSTMSTSLMDSAGSNTVNYQWREEATQRTTIALVNWASLRMRGRIWRALPFLTTVSPLWVYSGSALPVYFTWRWP